MLNYLLKTPDSTREQPCVPIVLDPNWERSPWANTQLQPNLPAQWDQRGDPVLIVLPVAPADVPAVLGPWSAGHVPVSRNMVRFLLPVDGEPNIYDDRDLILTARCAMLSKEWGTAEAQYDTLHRRRFQPELVTKLKERFNRYAILHVWDFQNPTQCTFHVEAHKATGGAIPAAVEKHIRDNFFAPEDFETFIVAAAVRGDSMREVLTLLRGEPLSGQEALPYLGQADVMEDVIAVAARDRIALNVGGTWYHREGGESESAALQRLRQKAFKTGQDLYLIRLGLPNQVGSGGVAAPASGGALPVQALRPAAVFRRPGPVETAKFHPLQGRPSPFQAWRFRPHNPACSPWPLLPLLPRSSASRWGPRPESTCWATWKPGASPTSNRLRKRF